MAEPSPVLLLWGDDPFLLRLSALEALEARGVRATEVDGREWQGGETSDLATPSLWGEQRALLITNAQSLPETARREVDAYIRAPSAAAAMVLTLVGRGRGTPALGKAVQQAGGTVRHVALTRQEIGRWLVERARVAGARMTAQAAAALTARVGEDLAALDQAVRQLASAFARRTIGPEEVRAQFAGLGEQRVWDLCDQAFAGRLPEALVTLRGLLEAREDPLLVLGGIASRIRDLIRVRSLPERMAPADAARAAGVRFDWQVRRYRDQARRYSLAELGLLHERAVESDQALKAGVPGDLVLSMMVTAMSGERDVRLTERVRVSR